MTPERLLVLDLFSGVGGFGLGMEMAGGFETVAFCEIDAFCRRVLAKHWPGVPIFEDIRELTRDAVGHVDVVTGGFPCQPFSEAGKRRGTDDDRYLWPEMLRVIDAFRPAWVIAENVVGLVSMVQQRGELQMESRTGGRFADGADYTAVGIRQEDMLLHGICEDLAKIGYEVAPLVVPAVAVDAKHRRDRIFIVANSRSGRFGGTGSRKEKQPRGAGAFGTSQIVANCHSDRQQQPQGVRPEERRRSGIGSPAHTSADATGAGRNTARGPGQAVFEPGAIERLNGLRRALSDAAISRLQERHGIRSRGKDADAATAPYLRWEPEPGLGRVAHGIPDRVDRLRGLGNAVVPAVVAEIAAAVWLAHWDAA